MKSLEVKKHIYRKLIFDKSAHKCIRERDIFSINGDCKIGFPQAEE